MLRLLLLVVYPVSGPDEKPTSSWIREQGHVPSLSMAELQFGLRYSSRLCSITQNGSLMMIRRIKEVIKDVTN